MKRFVPFLIILAMVISSCDSQEPITPQATDDATEALSKKGGNSGSDADEYLANFGASINDALADQGASYRVHTLEWIAPNDADEAGTTVIAKDVGNKQLTFDFVPFDARRAPWSGPTGGPDDDITYAVDTFAPQASNLPLAVSEAAIDRAMGTWDAAQCSDLPITKIPLPPGVDVGAAAGGFIVGDINHGGWLGLPPGVLGVTITFGFCAPCAPTPVFTDIDGNGKGDTAFRDIFYSSGFFWADDGVSNFDVETVALHEAGHGLSQAHFGSIQIKNNGNVQASPRAVMNAIYLGPFRNLAGTDNGGHCSNWAQWPNN